MSVRCGPGEMWPSHRLGARIGYTGVVSMAPDTQSVCVQYTAPELPTRPDTHALRTRWPGVQVACSAMQAGRQAGEAVGVAMKLHAVS